MSKLVVVCAGLASNEMVRGVRSYCASHPLFLYKVLERLSVGTKKAPATGALCARSVTSAGIHQHTRYGSPVIPPRLAANTSGSLVLPCYYDYSKTEYQTQHFLKEPMTSSNSSGSHLISDFQRDFVKNPRDHIDRKYYSHIVDFYQKNSDAPRFAFVDETYIPPMKAEGGYGMHQGFYSMTAVIIEADKLKEFRDALTSLDLPEQKFHAVDNSDTYNIRFLEFINRHLADSATVVTVGTAVDYSSDSKTQIGLVREARHSNLLSLIQQCQDRDNPVHAFVFERMQDKKENEMDLKAISNFLQAGLIKPIDQVQVSPGAERLLWTADAICYAVRKVLDYSNYDLYDAVKNNLEVYDAISHRYLDLSPGPNQQTPKNMLNFDAATTPIKELSDAELMQVASGRFVREEVIVTIANNGRGRVLQPENQKGIAYKRTQAQGHQHQLSPEQAVAQSIARGDMTPRQKQAFEELNRRGTPLPEGLQAVKASYERMKRAREDVFKPRNRNQQNQRSRNQGQQQQQNNQQQRNRRQERRRDRNQQQSAQQNQRRNGPRR